jgi:anaerobic magnesium-protoporphyrin IX monomethyl ester cyclase
MTRGGDKLGPGEKTVGDAVNRVAHASRRVSVDSVARVLFAHGHLLRWDAKQFAIGKPYPPLATLYAAAHARALGHEVALYDPMLNDDTSDFGRVLDREKPDVVVLYDDSFNWFTKMCLSRMRAAAHGMVSDARARGLPVVVAGHDAADDPETYLRSGAAFVIVGEGEVTLGELLAHFDAVIAACRAQGAGPNIDDVREAAAATPGLALLHKGFLRRTGARKLLKDLDVLPLPAWDLVDMGRYRAFWKRRHGYFSLNVVTTRGCPYLCNWCAKPVYGNTYHTRSPANVLAELRLLRDRYAPDHLWFCDDILGLKSRWLVAWSDAVAAEGLRTPFLCQTRADLMTEDNVRALQRAGARDVWLGAESGAQQILDAMEKGISVDQTRAAVARLHAAGVRVGLFLQFGYPGEGWDEVQATRAMVRELLPDDIGISVSYPLPGTRYHERMAARLGPKRNWSESSDLDPLVPGRFSPGFYKMLSRVVHAELRVLRGTRALKSLVRHPLRLDSYRLRRAAGLRHAGLWLLDRVRLEAERRRTSIDTGEADSYAAGNSSSGD